MDHNSNIRAYFLIAKEYYIKTFFMLDVYFDIREL